MVTITRITGRSPRWSTSRLSLVLGRRFVRRPDRTPASAPGRRRRLNRARVNGLTPTFDVRRHDILIAARCQQPGQLGLAVASSSPAVAARCAHVRAAVGAVAHRTSPTLAWDHADWTCWHWGRPRVDAVRILRTSAPHVEHRQVAVVDTAGRVADFPGENASGCMRSPRETVRSRRATCWRMPACRRRCWAGFSSSGAELGDRIMAAMQAGLAAGGEAGPVHSAGMLLADKRGVAGRRSAGGLARRPVREPGAALGAVAATACSYATRALDPDVAPGYGVPGRHRRGSRSRPAMSPSPGLPACGSQRKYRRAPGRRRAPRGGRALFGADLAGLLPALGRWAAASAAPHPGPALWSGADGAYAGWPASYGRAWLYWRADERPSPERGRAAWRGGRRP